MSENRRSAKDNSTASEEEFDVYDKVQWHYPGGKDCPSLEIGKRHIEVAMDFLDRHGLLSEEGREDWEDASLPADYALTTESVTDEGARFLRQYYKPWLKTISYSRPPDDSWLEARLAETRET